MTPNRPPRGAVSPPPSTPLSEAAVLLGISKDALKKRIARGTVPAEKRDGRWWVFLDTMPRAQDSGEDTREDTRGDTLVTALRAHIESLEETLRVRDREIERVHMLLAAALERPLAIEVESRESTGTDATGTQKRAPLSEDLGAQVSKALPSREELFLRRLWRRITGG